MAISKKSLSDFEQSRLKEVLVAAGDNVHNVPDAVKNAMHGVKDPGARYRLKLALTQVAINTITARKRKAEGKPPPQRLRDARCLKRDARSNELFLEKRLGPNDD
jgi:hypothetical protein